MGFLDKFFSDKKENKQNGTGTKIRKIRTQKKISAFDLGNVAGVNETAIRNYETGYRKVSNDKLLLISEKLGVPVETLVDRQINSYMDVIHILFELSEKYEFVPIELPQEPRYAIQTKDTVILQALQAWYDKRRQWENGSISRAEFQDWMDAFPLLCKDEETTEVNESLYSDFERILGLKSALEQMDMIVDCKVEEIQSCIAGKNNKMAQEHLESLKSTIHTLVQVDIQRYGK